MLSYWSSVFLLLGCDCPLLMLMDDWKLGMADVASFLQSCQSKFSSARSELGSVLPDLDV